MAGKFIFKKDCSNNNYSRLGKANSYHKIANFGKLVKSTMEMDLTTAFLETSYIAYLDREIVLKVGQLPDIIVQNFPHIKSWAFITAWNPLPDKLDSVQNKKRNDDLREHLVRAGYSFHPGVGVSKDKDWSEDSFFIENIELQKANEISRMFGQLAFVYGDCQTGNQLIFTR